jgi:hypothetical protein
MKYKCSNCNKTYYNYETARYCCEKEKVKEEVEE